MILGITGGLGCGKSTVARLLERRGFKPLASDTLVRERVLTDPEVIAVLRERYGAAILSPEGAVDRSRLAEKAFGDDKELAFLEELTHPRVSALRRAALAEDPKGPWAVEVPLLFEKSLEKWFDFIVCVACAPEQQLVRLEQRGLSRTFAGQRISKQLPLARKIESSDFVLWNEGPPTFLEAQVDRLVASLPR
ncbi:MAG TPA: dephospho-CoA kinase [Opitutaceae bacterium]|jgi:dephospho-CoA kinase|nr:dephospho-CoA kinase [Opitutaceae bacterium]